MQAFLDAVTQFPFMQYALLAGLLASIACGVVGSFVVVRRISYIAGGIAHSVLGGMGVARYLQVIHGWDWCSPMLGAIIAALIAAFIIGFVSFRGKQREDTVIGAIWAIGMAVGILFISQTPGYGEDLMGYLFGNILMVSRSDLFVIAALDAIVLAVVIVFYKRMMAVCFDEEFARVRGLNVEFYYLLLLCLTALTVVLLVSVVGIIMVIALVTLPAAIAGRFTNSLWGMMIVAVLLSSIFTTLGLALSFGPNLPAGATIIVIAGIAYVVFAISCGRRCTIRMK